MHFITWDNVCLQNPELWVKLIKNGAHDKTYDTYSGHIGERENWT